MALRISPRELIATQLRSLSLPLRFGQTLVGQGGVDRLSAELLAEVELRGKYTKAESLYAPVTPIPPLGFFYECSTCTFFQQTAKRSAGTCQVVEGSIAPYGWTPLWLPRKEDRLLGWLTGPLADWPSLFFQGGRSNA